MLKQSGKTESRTETLEIEGVHARSSIHSDHLVVPLRFLYISDRHM